MEKKGAHYYYGDEKIGMGRVNVLDILRDPESPWQEILEEAYKESKKV